MLVLEYNTIARFRSEYFTKCIEDLFNQLITKLKVKKEVVLRLVT